MNITASASSSVEHHETADEETSPSSSFFGTFFKAKGTIPALITSILLSFGIGLTVGIVPEIITDSYARINHDYIGIDPCYAFDHNDMPLACLEGADDAQQGSAYGALLLNLLILLCNPIVGRQSDRVGRRTFLCVGIFLNTLAPLMLLLMQISSSKSSSTKFTIHPLWYYVASSIVGLVNYQSIMFAALSDSMPEKYRAPTFALTLGGFYGGFALSPSLTLWLNNHYQATCLSCILTGISFVYTLLFFPETLSSENRTTVTTTTIDYIEVTTQDNHNDIDDDDDEEAEVTIVTTATADSTSTSQWLWKSSTGIIIRPIQEMVILNRNVVIRLVAIGSFFSSMVYATDVNLVLFYIEDYINVRDDDIAKMFFVMGILGATFQSFLLQPLISLLGEEGLLITAFCSGTFHNALYGLAKTKSTIYAALCFSQLTKTNFPILSSLASKNGATIHEQGQVQGALFALNALASAIGPLIMQAIYNRTTTAGGGNNSDENIFWGPGTMFLFASFLYFIGTISVSLIPIMRKKMDTDDGRQQQQPSSVSTSVSEPELEPRGGINKISGDLEEPLLRQNAI